MRYRDYKTFIADHYYHIFNRGNNKQVIFDDPSDYLNFLKRIKLTLGVPTPNPTNLHIKSLPQGSLSIIAYCLMPNHFHFLIRQNGDIGIDRFITKLCTSYSIYFNKKYKRIGQVFQDAFKAKIIDNDRYAMYLSAYIHNNPDKPREYLYSSFQDIIGARRGNLCDKKIILGWFNNNPETYRKFVLGFNRQQIQAINHLLFED